MNDYLILLQTEGGESAGGGMSQNLIMFALIGLVFYFFMIRPQMKRTKEAKKFREGLQKGDKVVTVGGIHGTVLEVGDTTVLMSCEGSTKFRVELSSVSANATDRMDTKK